MCVVRAANAATQPRTGKHTPEIQDPKTKTNTNMFATAHPVGKTQWGLPGASPGLRSPPRGFNLMAHVCFFTSVCNICLLPLPGTRGPKASGPLTKEGVGGLFLQDAGGQAGHTVC